MVFFSSVQWKDGFACVHITILRRMAHQNLKKVKTIIK